MEKRRKVPGQGFTVGTVPGSSQPQSRREASGKLGQQGGKGAGVEGSAWSITIQRSPAEAPPRFRHTDTLPRARVPGGERVEAGPWQTAIKDVASRRMTELLAVGMPPAEWGCPPRVPPRRGTQPA